MIMLLLLLGIIFPFQNCAPKKAQEERGSDSGLSSLYAYFMYDYNSKPSVYSNTALVFPTDSIGNFAKFKVMGMIAPADGSSGIVTYTVDVTDDHGNTICVGDSGTLESDVQNFEFQCLGTVAINKANVILKTTFNAQTETFKTTFIK